jgi:MoaA/NifB/PqqE/SkfB family radical SAM enzyme
MTRLTPRPTSITAEDHDLPLVSPVDPIDTLPIVMLAPHSRCNCRCVMCDIWRVTTKEEIAPEDLDRWLPEWRAFGVERVVLTGGEALMHSDIWALCRSLRAADIGITILSTGLLLEPRAPDLVRYVDDVVVSLDGPPEVHDRIRNIPNAFAKLAAGVRAVRSAAPGVSMSARCTVQRANFGHLVETVEAARSVGVDSVSFLAVDVSTEAFNRPEGWTPERRSEVAVGRSELPRLASELDSLEQNCRVDFEKGFIAESPAKLRSRLYDYFAALAEVGAFPTITCNAPWVSTVIETDGTVRPCFFHPPLGNVHDAGGLAAVLNAPSSVRWRRSLDVASDPICKRCVCSLALRRTADNG